MSLRDYSSNTIEQFSGSWTLPDPAKVNPPRALVSENMRYAPASVLVRDGFETVFTPSSATISIYNWQNKSFNTLFYLDGTSIKGRDLDTGVPSTLWTEATAVGLSVAEFGLRAIIATYTSDGVGAGQARITDLQNSLTAEVTAATSGTPVIITAAGHPFTDGMQVTLFGVQSPGIDGGHWYVTKMSSDTFALNGSNPYNLPVSKTGLSGAATADRLPLSVQSFVTDKCFEAPGIINPSPSSTTGGPNGDVVTPGTHRIGYVTQTRNGYTTGWGPAPGGNFVPVSVTTAAGESISVVISGAHPVTAAKYTIIMTRADNPNRWYFVPGAVGDVIGGTSVAVTIPVDISDEDLAAAASNDASEYGVLLHQSAAGLGPIEPSVVFSYGTRVGYVADDVVYFSDPNDPQHITEDQHGIILPGRRKVRSVMVHRGVCYLLGPGWTYAVTDNSDVPATWAEPQLVDGKIGTSAPKGTAVGANGADGWVADDAGLFRFDGVYSPGAYGVPSSGLPISWYNSDVWKRINWNAAYAVKVVDDNTGQRIMVFAPLDAATTASHILTWHYHYGKTPDAVMFSLNSIGSYSPADGAIVLDPTSKTRKLWVSGTKIMQESATAIDDDGTAIASNYQFPLVAKSPTRFTAFYGADLRVRGTGTLNLTAYSMGNKLSRPVKPIDLETEPGIEILRSFYVISERASLLLSGTTKWELSLLKQYYGPYATNR